MDIRLIDAISDVPKDGKSNVVVVGAPAGGDGSDNEGIRDDENENQMLEDFSRLMETMHREFEEPS